MKCKTKFGAWTSRPEYGWQNYEGYANLMWKLKTCLSDMENVMSVASAACVKILSWGKILTLIIRSFVDNVLSVTI